MSGAPPNVNEGGFTVAGPRTPPLKHTSSASLDDQPSKPEAPAPTHVTGLKPRRLPDDFDHQDYGKLLRGPHYTLTVCNPDESDENHLEAEGSDNNGKERKEAYHMEVKSMDTFREKENDGAGGAENV